MRRWGVRSVVALLVTLAGCDAVFGLERHGELSDASDASVDPDAPGIPLVISCSNGAPFFDDELTDAVPCKPWGNAFADTGTSVEQTMGQIRIRTSAHAAGKGAGCTGAGSSRALTSGGLIAVVSSVLTSDGAYTSINYGDNTLQVVNNEISFGDRSGASRYGSTAYNPATMRAWRIYAQSGRVFGAYSADGKTWFAVGDHAGSPPNDIVALFGGDSIDNAFPSGVGVYERIVLCP
jgi:hypothetical protein